MAIELIPGRGSAPDVNNFRIGTPKLELLATLAIQKPTSQVEPLEPVRRPRFEIPQMLDSSRGGPHSTGR